MDPITALMLAQAGVSVIGTIYNTLAANNNADESLRRQKEQYDASKAYLETARQNLKTDTANALDTIASSGASDAAARAQSGQIGPSASASTTSLLDKSVSSVTEQFNRTSNDILNKKTSLDQSFYNAQSDTDLAKNSAFLQGALSVGGTALGTAAGISGHLGELAAKDQQAEFLKKFQESTSYGGNKAGTPSPQQELPKAPQYELPIMPGFGLNQGFNPFNNQTLNGNFGQYSIENFLSPTKDLSFWDSIGKPRSGRMRSL